VKSSAGGAYEAHVVITIPSSSAHVPLGKFLGATVPTPFRWVTALATDGNTELGFPSRGLMSTQTPADGHSSKAKHVLLIEIDPRIEAELQVKAEASGLSVSELARRVLIEWLWQPPLAPPLTTTAVRLDPTKRMAILEGRSVHLSPVETKILAALIRSPGQMVTMEEMALFAWGPEAATRKGTIAVHVCRLREKLRPLVRIHGVRKQGYWLDLAPPGTLDSCHD